MPYVSPKGNVKSASAKAPELSSMTRSRRKVSTTELTHVPSRELGEIIYGRDADPEIVKLMKSLESWSPWSSPSDESKSLERLAQYDPLDSSSAAQIPSTRSTRPKFPTSRSGRHQMPRVDSGFSDTQSTETSLNV